MTPAVRIGPVRIVEAGLLLLATFGWMARLADLTPIFRDVFGIRPGPPAFAVVNPFDPLLRGLIGVAVLAYLLRLLWRPGPPRTADGLLSTLAWMLIAIGLATPAMRDMYDRLADEATDNQASFRSQTDDGGVIQTELAMAALADGDNPYAVDYGATSMARGRDTDSGSWERLGYGRDPALGHLPDLPASFIVSMPLWWASEGAFGWYDQRLFYVFAALAFTWLCGRLVEPGGLRRIVWLAAGASQLLLPFVRIGRNDIVLLLWLAAMALLVQRRQVVAAAGLLGLACATTQSAWVVALPFAVWVWFDPVWRGPTARRALRVAAGVFAAFCLPFALWSPADFFDDVLAFALGFSADAYPMSPDSMGAASLVLGMGWTNDVRGGFPMWALQLALTFPVAVALLHRLVRQPHPATMFLAAGIILYVALFSAPFFDISSLVVPVALLMFAGLLSRPSPDSPAG